MMNRDEVIRKKIERKAPKDIGSIISSVTSILEDSSLTAAQVKARLPVRVTERTIRKARQDRRPALERVYGLHGLTDKE
jgi:hypothetical protein